jgi:hypothetical protein
MMRKMLLAAAVCMLAVSVAGNGFALDRAKTLTQIGDESRDPSPWGSTDYCTLSYYNTCTGWIYVWGGWSVSDVVGVAFDPASCPPKADECATLLGAWFYFRNTYPTYGYTAAVGCATQGSVPSHLGAVTYLSDPQEWIERWNWVDLANCHVGGGGVAIIHFTATGPLSMATEALPLSCGGGSKICQTCPQPANSYYYGSLATGNFSGSSFYAGVYNPSATDILMDIVVACVGPTAVESSSWGNLKAMYE